MSDEPDICKTVTMTFSLTDVWTDRLPSISDFSQCICIMLAFSKDLLENIRNINTGDSNQSNLVNIDWTECIYNEGY